MTKYIIWRHGESISNATGNYSIKDPLLSSKGINQCKIVHRKYTSNDTSKKIVIISPLTRAIQTAKILYPDAQLYACELLREINNGSLANQPLSKSELMDLYPGIDFERYYKSDIIPIEKTYGCLTRRIGELFQRIKMGNPPEKIVLVCHGVTAHNIMKYLGSSNPRMLKNCHGVGINQHTNNDYREF